MIATRQDKGYLSERKVAIEVHLRSSSAEACELVSPYTRSYGLSLDKEFEECSRALDEVFLKESENINEDDATTLNENAGTASRGAVVNQPVWERGAQEELGGSCRVLECCSFSCDLGKLCATQVHQG